MNQYDTEFSFIGKLTEKSLEHKVPDAWVNPVLLIVLFPSLHDAIAVTTLSLVASPGLKKPSGTGIS